MTPTNKEKFKMDPERALEKVSEMPRIRTEHRKVKDSTGRIWVITETTITDWKPASYFEKMLEPEEGDIPLHPGKRLVQKRW